MKKILFTIMLSAITFISNAQDEETDQKGGFKKENLFTGGSVTVSFANSMLVLGASPVFGYSINNWLDAGILVNFNYSSDRHVTYFDGSNYYISDDRLRQTTFGPGTFIKVYPVKFLFLQAQGEYNFSSQKLIFDSGSPSERKKVSAPSLLVGGGYCNGREGARSLFYYLSVLVDVAGNKNSPYVEQTSNGRIIPLPIVRAGIQVPLFQGKK